MQVKVTSKTGVPFRKCTPLRKGGAIWGKMLGVIPHGTTCTLLHSFTYQAGKSNTKNGKWILVQFGVESGWALGQFFEKI